MAPAGRAPCRGDRAPSRFHHRPRAPRTGSSCVEADPVAIVAARLPEVLRWSGAIARRLRAHDIAVGGKASGSADTDALTLTDLAVQELLVSALRDAGPEVRACRLEAEEAAGDLGR